MSEKPVSENKSSAEIDMTDFLKLLGKGFTRIAQGITWLFTNAFELLILFFLFLKRKIGWLGLAFFLGLGFGFYTYYSSGTTYRSEMITRSNFESTYFLYNQVEYFNSLIKNKNLSDLSKIFNINETDAKALVNFDASPIKTDIEAAKLYRQIFLRTKRNHTYGFDTIWSRTMKFNDFKKQLTNYDYPLNRIIVKSKLAGIFPKIQQGFLNSLNNDPYLKEKKERFQQIRQQEEQLLTDALTNIDTLRQVYNKKLTMPAENTPAGGSQLILGERNVRNPELDLYDKTMLIKDELMELKAVNAEEKEPLVLYAALGSTGTAEALDKSILPPALYLMAAMFFILLIIEFVTYLTKLETRKKAKIDS
ncbi:MAG TPA: hypothetical protein VF144_13820 [Chitinophagaceae bacterium]